MVSAATAEVGATTASVERDDDDPRNARLRAVPFPSRVRDLAAAEAREAARVAARGSVVRDVLRTIDLLRAASTRAAVNGAVRTLHARCYRRLHGLVALFGGDGVPHGEAPTGDAVALVREAARVLRAARRVMETFADVYPKAKGHVAFVLDALAEADEPQVEGDDP